MPGQYLAFFRNDGDIENFDYWYGYHFVAHSLCFFEIFRNMVVNTIIKYIYSESAYKIYKMVPSSSFNTHLVKMVEKTWNFFHFLSHYWINEIKGILRFISIQFTLSIFFEFFQNKIINDISKDGASWSILCSILPYMLRIKKKTMKDIELFNQFFFNLSVFV